MIESSSRSEAGYCVHGRQRCAWLLGCYSGGSLAGGLDPLHQVSQREPELLIGRSSVITRCFQGGEDFVPSLDALACAAVMVSRNELNRLFLAICDLAIEWRDSADQTEAQCGEELLDLIDGDHPAADASKSRRHNPTGIPSTTA